MTSSAKPSWADWVAGMIDPHLYVSRQAYRELKEEAAEREGFPEVYPFYRVGIPIHVEPFLPFIDHKGNEVHIVALDHDKRKPKTGPEPIAPHRWWFPPRFEFGTWPRPHEFEE